MIKFCHEYRVANGFGKTTCVEKKVFISWFNGFISLGNLNCNEIQARLRPAYIQCLEIEWLIYM